MEPWFDLHRHDEYSSFDGFGKSSELAKLASSYGYTALGISNHGNTNGLVQHYIACKNNGIKPILGVEGYFIPKYKEKHRGYHLCLYAENLTGYRNINEIQYEGDKQRYYNPIWTLDLLEKYSDGVICTSACIASFLSQSIKNGRMDVAENFARRMKRIFKDRFYIEIQPYPISEKGLQEKVNYYQYRIAKKLGIKPILTSDSHYGERSEFPTYLKMHEIAGHDLEHITSTYKERYMPKPGQIKKRFIEMMEPYFGSKVEEVANECYDNLKEIQDRVEGDIFDSLEQTLPNVQDGQEDILVQVKNGLKKKGKWKEPYISRIKEEMEVINSLGFADYFLMVADYVNWAKSNGIAVGPGRGSACNCEVAYALGITEVDSLYYNLDFRRFLRKDKKKMPDIDIDFEKSRRHEVITYITEKYKGKSARIASYGLYKVDNLINDLAKVCGLKTTKDEEHWQENKEVIKEIKSHINRFVNEDLELDSIGLITSKKARIWDVNYDHIITHFCKLYKKVRFIGTHAAGVAITGGDILDYTSLRVDPKTNEIYTNYDLNDLETIHIIKFDILGLATMEEIGELREVTGDTVVYEDLVNNRKVLRQFSKSNTTGVFQFDKDSVKNILADIKCNCFEDIVAANAMNRPGPLSMDMPQKYAYNKENEEESKHSLYYKYTKDSYGTVIYQEQIQAICVYIAGMEWGDADKVMKMIGGQSQSEDAKAEFEKNKKELGDKFITGAIKNGVSKEDANSLWSAMLVYSFNKGHAVGYSLISMEEMYYKVYHPIEFWFAKLKYCPTEANIPTLEREVVQGGNIILLPHVNGTARYSIALLDDEQCIQRGLVTIKGIGEKAAMEIENEKVANGPFKNYKDFCDRMEGNRAITTRIINLLENSGALEFNQKKFLGRTEKLNISLYGRN